MHGRTRQVLEILLPSLAELLPPTSFLALAATNKALEVGSPAIIRALAEQIPELKVAAVARRVAEASHPLREIKRVALAARKLKREPSYPETIDATLPYTCVATITTHDGERLVETGTLAMNDMDEQCHYTEMGLKLSGTKIVDHRSFDVFAGPGEPGYSEELHSDSQFGKAFYESCENRCHVRIVMVRDYDGAVLVLFDGPVTLAIDHPSNFWFNDYDGIEFNVPTNQQIMEWPYDLRKTISTEVVLFCQSSTRIEDDLYGYPGCKLYMRIWIIQAPGEAYGGSILDPARDHQYFNKFAAPSQACFVRYLNYIGDWR